MSVQVINDRDQVARKQHDCIWCREKIDAGTKYHLQVVVVENYWQANKYHPECFEAAGEFWRDDPGCLFDAHSFKRGSTEEA